MRQLRVIHPRRATYPVWVWLVVLFFVAYLMGCRASIEEARARAKAAVEESARYNLELRCAA